MNAIATAGKTIPVKGTRTDGRKDAAIIKPPKKIGLQFKTSLLQIAPS